jgi:hypothetical protein
MPCIPFTFKGGRGFMCTRTPARVPRCVCGLPSAYQCDAPSQRKSGTCDRHLCAGCATEVGPDKHLCRTHAAEQSAKAPELF